MPANYAQGDSSFFCHQMAVTAFDHTFLPRRLARAAPAVQLGGWSNAAELVVVLMMGIYTAACLHDVRLTSMRIGSTGADRLIRTAFLRRAVEEWKSAVVTLAIW